jgi:hypothetical protein
MSFLIIVALMFIRLSSAEAQPHPTPLPPVVVREAPLPLDAVPDRLQ